MGSIFNNHKTQFNHSTSVMYQVCPATVTWFGAVLDY